MCCTALAGAAGVAHVETWAPVSLVAHNQREAHFYNVEETAGSASSGPSLRVMIHTSRKQACKQRRLQDSNMQVRGVARLCCGVRQVSRRLFILNFFDIELFA